MEHNVSGMATFPETSKVESWLSSPPNIITSPLCYVTIGMETLQFDTQTLVNLAVLCSTDLYKYTYESKMHCAADLNTSGFTDMLKTHLDGITNWVFMYTKGVQLPFVCTSIVQLIKTLEELDRMYSQWNMLYSCSIGTIIELEKATNKLTYKPSKHATYGGDNKPRIKHAPKSFFFLTIHPVKKYKKTNRKANRFGGFSYRLVEARNG